MKKMHNHQPFLHRTQFKCFWCEAPADSFYLTDNDNLEACCDGHREAADRLVNKNVFQEINIDEYIAAQIMQS